MAFTPLYGDEGKYCSVGFATGTTVVKGNAVVDNGSGYMTNASAGGNVDILYVAVESVVTAANNEQVLCVRTNGVTFLADCDAAWAQTDVGTYADLAAAGQVDPNASTDDIFYIEKGVGVAATGTQVVGQFQQGVPNS
jgi:hypothetical protein